MFRVIDQYQYRWNNDKKHKFNVHSIYKYWLYVQIEIQGKVEKTSHPKLDSQLNKHQLNTSNLKYFDGFNFELC